jgi:hypothetical protein
MRETEQANLLFDEINKILESDKKKLESNIVCLGDKIKEDKHRLHETEQQNKILNDIIELNLSKNHHTHYAVIPLCCVFLLISTFIILEYHEKPDDLKTGYFTYDLRGDQVSSAQKWNKPEGSSLMVYVQNIANVPDEKIRLVNDAISSKETLQIDDTVTHKAPSGEKSTFYLGWGAVLEDDLKFSTIFVDSIREADIIISLIETKNMDGYSGWTESTTKDGEILQSHITIFNAHEISEQDLSTIMRHEFGHALGLGHSTDPEDLMYPTITTMPYISECDYAALVSTYKLDLAVHTCEK